MVADMAAQYDAWAARCGVIARDKIVALMSSQGVTRAFWEKDE
jgi:arylsulfatase